MSSLYGTLVPNSTDAGGFWSVVGAASHHAALADASDSTYVQEDLGGTGSGQMRVGLTDMGSLPPDVLIDHLTVTFRASAASSSNGPQHVTLDLPGAGSLVVYLNSFNTSTQDYSASFTERPGGGGWTTADINALLFSAYKPSGDLVTPRIYRVQVGVYTNALPTATPTGPTGTVTYSSQPILTWTINGEQVRYDVRLFSGGSAVTDPSTETARLLWSSGSVFTTAPNARVGVSLSDGSYRWAVRITADGSTFGAWNQASLTIDVPSPTPPTVTVVPDPTNNRMIVTPHAGAGDPPEGFVVYRSDDAGATWVPTRFGNNVAGTFYDYEAARVARPSTAAITVAVGYNAHIGYNEPGQGYDNSVGTVSTGIPNLVRYRAYAYAHLGTELIVSAWGPAMTPDGLVGNCQTWLKHPTNPALSMVIQQVANFETEIEQVQSVMRAANRQDWVIFSLGPPSLERGEFSAIFAGDAAWANFEFLILTGVPLLLQTVFGNTIFEQHWVRFGPITKKVNVTHSGQHTLQYRRCTVGFHEVATPLVTA